MSQQHDDQEKDDVRGYLADCFQLISQRLLHYSNHANLEDIELAYLHSRAMMQVVHLAGVPRLVDSAISAVSRELKAVIISAQHCTRPKPPQQQHSHTGRPKYLITEDQISFFLAAKFTIPQIASLLHVSRTTICNRMADFHITVADFRSHDVTDDQLSEKIASLLSENANLGERLITGHLVAQGLKLPRWRIRDAIHRIRLQTQRPFIRALRRRVYNVQAPQSLWHIDGHHKLIRWRYVIHGGIDGFSRLIVYLNASDNNRAQTVLDCFVKAVDHFGLPQCVRSDKGGENVQVCSYMLNRRGPECIPFITGKSVHNQRIERLWRDLFEGIVCVYSEAFHDLESKAFLDPASDIDCFCLHLVYSPLLNQSLQRYTEMWNHHVLRTEGLSPIQLFLGGLQMQTDSTVANEHFDMTFLHHFAVFGDAGLQATKAVRNSRPARQHSDDFGIDWEGPIPADEDDNVTVPQSLVGISEADEQRLRANVDFSTLTLENAPDAFIRTKTTLLRMIA